jgi:hypothetical protein
MLDHFPKRVQQNVQNALRVITHLRHVHQSVNVVQQERLIVAKEVNIMILLTVYVVVLMNMQMINVQKNVNPVQKGKLLKEKHVNLNVLNVKIAKKLNLV